MQISSVFCGIYKFMKENRNLKSTFSVFLFPVRLETLGRGSQHFLYCDILLSLLNFGRTPFLTILLMNINKMYWSNRTNVVTFNYVITVCYAAFVLPIVLYREKRTLWWKLTFFIPKLVSSWKMFRFISQPYKICFFFCPFMSLCNGTWKCVILT